MLKIAKGKAKNHQAWKIQKNITISKIILNINLFIYPQTNLP